MRCPASFLIVTAWLLGAGPAASVDFRAAVSRIDHLPPPPVSSYDLKPADLAVANAVFPKGNTAKTDRFLGGIHETITVLGPPEVADAALDDNVRLIFVLFSTADLLHLIDNAAAAGVLAFNSPERDTTVWDEQCRPNLFYVTPSRAIQAAAVAQLAFWNEWTGWFLISDSDPKTLHWLTLISAQQQNLVHEAWGETQFSTRFEALTDDYVCPEDYDTWLAPRVIGKAVSRNLSAEPDQVLNDASSDAFEPAVFKGKKATFRDWRGQLRRPVPLYDGSITVSVSPQAGYLHQTSVLDTFWSGPVGLQKYSNY